jgi:hypothetical protein
MRVSAGCHVPVSPRQRTVYLDCRASNSGQGEDSLGLISRSLGPANWNACQRGSADSGNGLLRYAVIACLKKAPLFRMQTQ